MPEAVKIIGAENRICSGGIFRNRANGESIVVFNTHLDHIGETVQCEGARLIIDRLSRFGDVKTVLVGDFNVTPEDKAYGIFTKSGFSDARSIAEDADDTDSFHWFGSTSKMIDFVFVKNNVTVKKLKTATDKICGRYPSDHYPVVADVE